MIKMSDTRHSPATRPDGRSSYRHGEASGWAGWIGFAAIVALMLGGAHIMMGSSPSSVRRTT
jgi:hypothetical protein